MALSLIETPDSESENKAVRLRTFEGREEIRCIAFFPDARKVVTGASNGVVDIWELVDDGLQEGMSLKGHTGAVLSVAVSKDGRWIASGGRDKKVLVWGAADQQLRYSLQGHDSFVFSVNFSPDGRLLASTSWDEDLRLWRLDTGECAVGPIRCVSSGETYSVVFSPDGSSVATAGGQVQIRSAATGELERILIETSASALVWSLDGLQIITYDGDKGEIAVFDAIAGHEIRRWVASSNKHATSLSLSSAGTGTLLASSSFSDTAARLWDVRTGLQVSTLEHDSPIRCVAYSLDGKSMATVCADKKICLWEAPGEPEVLETTDHDSTNDSVLDRPATVIPGGPVGETNRGVPYDRSPSPTFYNPAPLCTPTSAIHAPSDHGLRAKLSLTLKNFVSAFRKKNALRSAGTGPAGGASTHEKSHSWGWWRTTLVASSTLKKFVAVAPDPDRPCPQQPTVLVPDELKLPGMDAEVSENLVDDSGTHGGERCFLCFRTSSAPSTSLPP